MPEKFLRITVSVNVPIIVGPIDIQIPEGVNVDDWPESDILAAAQEIVEDAMASALPGSTTQVDAYPRSHPCAGQWVTVKSDYFPEPWEDEPEGVELVDTEEVEHA